MATTQILGEFRAGTEMISCLRSDIYRHPPVTGKGQPVLLLPGLGAGEESLRFMASWLHRSGYHPCKSGIHFNIECSEATMAKLEQRLEDIVDKDGHKAIIIGHSRGGQFAKVLANRHPDKVQSIVAMGSPMMNSLHGIHPLLRLQLLGLSRVSEITHWGLGHGCAYPEAFEGIDYSRFEQGLHEQAQRKYEQCEHCCHPFWEDLKKKLPKRMGYLILYSDSDGVVSAASAYDPQAERIRVTGSHIGMACSTSTFQALAPWLADQA